LKSRRFQIVYFLNTCPDRIERQYCFILDDQRREVFDLQLDPRTLEVITSQRRVTQHTTAQRALGSLIGLLFATSGCPHTDYFKPMARFHLPLASMEDTMFRVTSMYLMAQYFRHKEGRKSDFEFSGLKNIFANMHLLNIMIAERIRNATQTDSSLNAVIQLDTFLGMMPFVSEEQMAELRHLFVAYL